MYLFRELASENFGLIHPPHPSLLSVHSGSIHPPHL